jgi:hypothetical protein
MNLNLSPSIRTDNQQIRGWRNEFRCWWRMAKYVDVVFDKSGQGPGSTSICRSCCQILETRTCNGDTDLSASGCTFHLEHPHVPFAVTSTVTSSRLRDMLRPSIFMRFYFLRSGASMDLKDVGWVKTIREGNEETRKSRKVYKHGETCLYGPDPEGIVQGKGVEGIYWRQCDGRWVNALGAELRMGEEVSDVPAVAVEHVDLVADEVKMAEAAWRRHHVEKDYEDEEEKAKSRLRCVVM